MSNDQPKEINSRTRIGINLAQTCTIIGLLGWLGWCGRGYFEEDKNRGELHTRQLVELASQNSKMELEIESLRGIVRAYRDETLERRAENNKWKWIASANFDLLETSVNSEARSKVKLYVLPSPKP